MEDKDLRVLPLAELMPYPGHIFAPYEGERFGGMVDSVKEHGVITPVKIGTFLFLSLPELKNNPNLIKKSSICSSNLAEKVRIKNY